MNTYHIVSSAGVDLGCYAAETEGDALSQMSIDAWYSSVAHASTVAGGFDVRVDECHLYLEGPASDETRLTPSDLGVTWSEYVERMADSYAAGESGIIRVRGRRVYAA